MIGRKKNIEKHLFISDFQIPDHDVDTISALHKFIKDFKPDVVHNVGDFLNCDKVSRYQQNPRYHMNLIDEIEIGREVLKELTHVTREANPHARIIWYEGNHEERLTTYLGNAPQLADLKDQNGDYVISMQHLFDLKSLGVEWISYNQRSTTSGGIEVEHGDRVSQKSGATAYKMMEARGTSGISGHTHRLAYVTKSWLDFQTWWIELGSFCNRQMLDPYMRRPGDWQQGFAIGLYDKEKKVMHPSIIPVLDHSFVYGDTIYRP